MVAGWLLRTVAAAQFAVSPVDVVIDRRCGECGRNHGKPRIVTGGRREVHASVTHSGAGVGVALSTAGEVGIDVEELASVPGGVARRALSPAEREVLAGVPVRAREEGGVRMWVRKEAALKATGHGLRISPERVEVTGPGEPPAVLSWPLDLPPDRLWLRELDPGPGSVGALALLGEAAEVKVSEAHLGGRRPAGRARRPRAADAVRGGGGPGPRRSPRRPAAATSR